MVSVNNVALHWARLLLGWVTADAVVSGDKNKDDAVEDEVQGFLFSRLK